MSLNFLTKSMWEGKKWIIPGYLISGDTRYSRQLCVCEYRQILVSPMYPMYCFLWSTHILRTYATSYLGKRERVREFTAAMPCVILYTLVWQAMSKTMHVVKVFQTNNTCSRLAIVKVFILREQFHLWFMLDKFKPRRISNGHLLFFFVFVFNSSFMCFFLLMKFCLLLFYCSLFLS